MIRVALLLWLLLTPAVLWASGSEQTLNTLPTNNSSFMTSLQTFLKREDAQRYALQFSPFVLSGGTHSTAGSLTAAPDALTAFPGGHYVTEVGSITYLDNETTWVIVHKDLTGNFNNFVRVPGTHYLIDSISATKPALPSASAWLMEVTTSAGAITAVLDLRSRNAAVPFTQLVSELDNTAGTGQLSMARRGVGITPELYYSVSGNWRPALQNVLTSVGDIIQGAATGFPLRLPIGEAYQLLGVADFPDAGLEYKTLVAGSGISIDQAPNTITFTQTGVSPPGILAPYVGATAPTGWLLCDGTAYLASTYPNLFTVYVSNAAGWGLGTALGTFTVNTGTDTLTIAGHGLVDDDILHLSNAGGGLPAGLAANTKYFALTTTTDTLQLALTAGGAAVDITTAGSGTHSIHLQFLVPNLNGRSPVGVGAAVTDLTITAVDTGTEQLTITSNTALYTGDLIQYNTTGGAITGLVDATNYYVIRLSATTVQLATSEALANAGTAINLTGAGSGVQVLRQTLTTRTAGTLGGTENNAGVPAHKHTITDPTHVHGMFTTGGGAASFPGNTGASGNVNTNAASTGVTVDNSTSTTSPGANMSPFLAITYIVKT